MTTAWVQPDELFHRQWQAAEDVESVAHLTVVHGFAEHGERYTDLAEAAAERGVTVTAVDLPGHGRSPGPRGLVEDVDAVVEAILRLEADVATPGKARLLFGHSFGGAIALLMLARDPQRFAGAVISAPYLTAAHGTPPWLVNAAVSASRWFPRLRSLPIDPADVSEDVQEQRRYDEDPYVDRGGVRLASLRELTRVGSLVRSEASQITSPTVIVHGTRDRLASFAASQALADRYEHLRLRPVDGGAHNLFRDPGGSELMREALRHFDAWSASS